MAVIKQVTDRSRAVSITKYAWYEEYRQKMAGAANLLTTLQNKTPYRKYELHKAQAHTITCKYTGASTSSNSWDFNQSWVTINDPNAKDVAPFKVPTKKFVQDYLFPREYFAAIKLYIMQAKANKPPASYSMNNKALWALDVMYHINCGLLATNLSGKTLGTLTLVNEIMGMTGTSMYAEHGRTFKEKVDALDKLDSSLSGTAGKHPLWQYARRVWKDASKKLIELPPILPNMVGPNWGSAGGSPRRGALTEVDWRLRLNPHITPLWIPNSGFDTLFMPPALRNQELDSAIWGFQGGYAPAVCVTAGVAPEAVLNPSTRKTSRAAQQTENYQHYEQCDVQMMPWMGNGWSGAMRCIDNRVYGALSGQAFVERERYFSQYRFTPAMRFASQQYYVMCGNKDERGGKGLYNLFDELLGGGRGLSNTPQLQPAFFRMADHVVSPNFAYAYDMGIVDAWIDYFLGLQYKLFIEAGAYAWAQGLETKAVSAYSMNHAVSTGYKTTLETADAARALVGKIGIGTSSTILKSLTTPGKVSTSGVVATSVSNALTASISLVYEWKLKAYQKFVEERNRKLGLTENYHVITNPFVRSLPAGNYHTRANNATYSTDVGGLDDKVDPNAFDSYNAVAKVIEAMGLLFPMIPNDNEPIRWAQALRPKAPAAPGVDLREIAKLMSPVYTPQHSVLFKNVKTGKRVWVADAAVKTFRQDPNWAFVRRQLPAVQRTPVRPPPTQSRRVAVVVSAVAAAAAAVFFGFV
jgi:hypothetical protein